MGPASERLRILVVATRPVAQEARDLLIEAGFPEPTLGDGGDETFLAYESKGPHIVLLGAYLERGDARSLAAAMKAGEHGHFVRVILLGEEDGPIRSALDAADFEVDRFLARPLAAKALSFAVHSCGAAALKAQGEGAPRPVAPPAQAMVEALPVREPTMIVRPPAAANDDGDDVMTSEGQTNPRVAFAPTELGAAGSSDTGRRRHSQLIDEAMEAAIAEFVSDAISSVSVGLDDRGKPIENGGGVPSATPTEETRKVEFPPASAGVREPTLILSPTDAMRVSQPPSFEVTAQSTEVPFAPTSASDWRADARSVGDALAADAGLTPKRSEGAHGEISDDELLDQIDADERLADRLDLSDLDDDGPTGAVADNETTLSRGARVGAAQAAAPRPVNGPASGSVARELRRKMSAMAERLFPGQVAGAGETGAWSLPHDANTEIDFSALEGGQTGVLTATSYRGIGRAETFADTNPRILTEETEASSASAPGTGELADDGEDIAIILARLHLADFSGAVKLTSGETEKTIHFDAGRPAFASSSLARDRMGDLLFREGKISREQHRSCNEKIEGSGRRMGELLVEMGYLKPRELLPAVRRHIEDIFYSVFSWRTGRYEILEREASAERIRLSRHPAALVVEGVRRKYDPARIEARLGGKDAVLAPTDDKAIDSFIPLADLAPEEQAALALFDGARTISAVAEAASLDRLTVAQLGFSLVALGAAEIVYQQSGDDAATDSGRASALVGETDIAIDRQRVLAKLALVEDADYFMLLGVRRDASRFEIQRAYEAARRDYASDAFPDAVRDELAGELEVIGELIEEAFQILGNDGMRLAYLEHLQ